MTMGILLTFTKALINVIKYDVDHKHLVIKETNLCNHFASAIIVSYSVI